LPGRFTAIECGRKKSAGARLLGFTTMEVSVIDHAGKKLWSESAMLGMDGAHWGDLTGDGDDAMIIGMNGFGGLEAMSADGNQLWSAGMGNVWSQAIVPASSNRSALVLATDATGCVSIFDAAGQRQNSLRADGGYFVEMTAGVVESNAVQIIAFSGSAVEAFDPTGKAAWKSSAQALTPASRQPCAALGDLKGDGAKEWAFVDGGGALVIATTGGLMVSSIPNQSSLQGLAIAPRPGQGGLLITLDGGSVRARSFGP
jgi:hypothetical protein